VSAAHLLGLAIVRPGGRRWPAWPARAACLAPAATPCAPGRDRPPGRTRAPAQHGGGPLAARPWWS